MEKEVVQEPKPMYGSLFTYADYLTWEFECRLELIRGKIFWMTPAPNRLHQEVSGNIARKFYQFFPIASTCSVYVAPFDVRLIDPNKKSTADQDIFTVVQPDICVVCDDRKLDERGCIGAPDLVIEILSPSNTNKELGVKYDIYEENGVQEYWLVNPAERAIFQYVLRDGQFVGLKPRIVGEQIQSEIFTDLIFPVEDIFLNS